MNHGALWQWGALLALGAYHGLNPGMGWLFAVGLAMQERSARAVWLSAIPLAGGHLLAIGAVVFVLALAHTAFSLQYLKWIVSAMLIGLGVFRLFRSRHPRRTGMRAGFRDLTAWSFLMASAHGAGLMLFPVLLGMEHAGAHAAHAHAMAGATKQTWLIAVLVHTFGYFAVTLAVAFVVYEKLGLALLRTAWINLDFIWCVVLILTGVLALFI